MKKLLKLTAILTVLLFINSCNREDFDADDFAQEEITNIILLVKDRDGGNVKTYNYAMGGNADPVINLTDGHTYDVETVFMNGNVNITNDIIAAKDEHFLVYRFSNSDIHLVRTDDAAATRTDGVKLGIKTLWMVTKASQGGSAKLVLKLIHGARAVADATTVVTSPGQYREFGQWSGGETDAEATFGIRQ
ncbi:MAG: hypothetical protein EAS48_00275 [Chryseobacterium sp.]|nr:MAG: hypothetical protein EAS48_00275 [Chryseobacterium sp.]